MKLNCLIPLLLLVLGTACKGLRAQSSLSEYELSFYGTTSSSSPNSIIRKESNGEILLACRQARTLAELERSKIPFSAAQIELLKEWGLLDEKEGRLTTVLPIIDRDETEELRRRLRASANRLLDRTEGEFRDFVHALDEIGRRRNAFTLLFSYVLDDLVWDEFVQREALKEKYARQSTALWRGTVWAIYPPRTFQCGTNSISDQGVRFSVNWSKVALVKMQPFITRFDLQGQMLQDYIREGRIVNTEARRVFEAFRFFDSEGRLTVPVIRSAAEEGLYQRSRALASQVAAFVTSTWPLEKMPEDLHLDDTDTALIIAYHEFMWEVLEVLAERSVVEKPAAFTNPKAAQPADIGDLIFIVDGR